MEVKSGISDTSFEDFSLPIVCILSALENLYLQVSALEQIYSQKN